MPSQLTATDRAHLARALELAEGGRGRVSPNPLVGAVVADGERVLGEGFHAELGGLHAERAALADCAERGLDPRGATIYVTLEPCAHHGRQPPCVDAIAEAGLGRVVYASEDPSEKAAGRGPGILRDAGVEVAAAAGGVAAAARLLNQPCRPHALNGLPLVTLKLAISLDGGTVPPPGDSPWISGPESRAAVHRWRAESDAIAVGIGTVLADDPLLTARDIEGARQPLRVVFDRSARLPLGSRLLDSLDVSPVLAFVGADADTGRVAALRDAGAEVIAAGDLGNALRALGERGVTSLFLEGGATLAAAFAEAGEVDEARVFVAPVLLGGGRRVEPVDSAATDTLIETRFREW
jgi:diaminohydroxyphosphoribosylaminopyrimidine deaminase/5-amino-6-(5-phosphoribosylamino)uracil reductase